MRKIVKIPLIIVLILISAVIIDRLTIIIKVQHVTKDVQTVEGMKEPIDSNTSEIYCEYMSGDNEYGDWVVIGKDGVLFKSDKKKWEEIIVVGNVPKKMNHRVLGSIFVFQGKYLGIKKEKVDKYLNGYNYDCKTFKAENWFINYPIKRISSEKNYPKDGFCLADIMDAERMPVREVVEDDN